MRTLKDVITYMKTHKHKHKKELEYIQNIQLN